MMVVLIVRELMVEVVMGTVVSNGVGFDGGDSYGGGGGGGCGEHDLFYRCDSL